jgi:hypothetical protein
MISICPTRRPIHTAKAFRHKISLETYRVARGGKRIAEVPALEPTPIGGRPKLQIIRRVGLLIPILARAARLVSEAAFYPAISHMDEGKAFP